MKKRFLCIIAALLLFVLKAYSVEYTVIKNNDTQTIIKYVDTEKKYYVIACYYKLYFEIQVEMHFEEALPSNSTLTSLEWEQFHYLTRYFHEMPYNPPVNRRKASPSRKLYTFTILYKGRVID